MLVLTRRLEESIVIGGNIIITILGVEGEKVKVGIDAPRDVPILRRELFNAIQQQKEAAKHLAAGPEPPAVEGLREILSQEGDPAEPDADLELK